MIAKKRRGKLYGRTDISALHVRIWTIGGNSYFVYYYIISYQRIKVYRVEIMDIGKISLAH